MVGVCLGLFSLGFFFGSREGEVEKEFVVIKCFKCSYCLEASFFSLWLHSATFQVRSDDPRSLHSNVIEKGTQSVVHV